MKTSPAFFIARQLYITAKCTHEIPFSSSAFIYMYLSLYFWVAAQMKKKKQKDDDDPRDYFKDNREDIYLIYIGV